MRSSDGGNSSYMDSESFADLQRLERPESLAGR